ncbi:MAG: pyrroline-5-carboxylate reductase [Deferrisomatales bacterium]|nr:pyrroline-5-carboxylate reductase [Deferrisomatales bacterium]
MRGLPRLAVIGVGNMGEALIQGLLGRGLLGTGDIVGAERLASRAQEVAARHGVTVHPDPGQACAGARAVLLAVKPQDVDATLAELAPHCADALVISICAGITLEQLDRGLPPGTAVARVMPNSPALVGAGVSVYCPNTHVDAVQMGWVETLLGAVGTVHRVDKEALLDAVTGLSGSGPAYAFAFLEALADGGVLMGLPRPLARALASQTLLGAATLAATSQEHPAELRDRVTSPAGTTAAGLRALEAGGFRHAVQEAVRAGTLRSRELGGS